MLHLNIHTNDTELFDSEMQVQCMKYINKLKINSKFPKSGSLRGEIWPVLV